MQESFDFTDINLITDNYEGITIDKDTIPHNIVEFEKELTVIIDNLTNKKLLWIKLHIDKSHYIPLLTKYDFIFHHCNEEDITLLKRLSINPIIPTARNHTLGVGVVVINEKNELLVIRDRIGKRYKLPGGYIDNDENISTAAVREVKEETGIDVDFTSIIALGHFKPLQFGESNLYLGCTAKANSSEINIIDDYEIIEARWMVLDEFLNHEEVLEFNKKIVNTAIQNSGLRFEHIEMFKNRDIDYELFF
ncbi:NUDIX domain-containing protein [Arcobacteraceae bacterium]|nr:NUDIX domain-containing protein [Arcobacteraceae bacterium]